MAAIETAVGKIMDTPAADKAVCTCRRIQYIHLTQKVQNKKRKEFLPQSTTHQISQIALSSV